MKLYTKEMFLIAAEKCEVSMIDAEHIMKYIDEYVTPIELPSDEEIGKIAQWVVDNRYPKSEFNKVSDFEMYHHIIKLIKEQILNQNK